MNARDIIAALDMKPHPEGGWYVETMRDNPNGGPNGERGHSTAIYFLLERSQQSAWHCVRDAVEVWHFHAGAPLELRVAPASGPVEAFTLGIDIPAGERPQAIVPAGHWQSAASLGDWALVGCTVAPGFEFSSSEMAPSGWEPGQPLV